MRGAPRFTRPHFRVYASRCWRHSQAGFCPYTPPRTSIAGEPTFGNRRCLFAGVPPQPNCPPTAVPERRAQVSILSFERQCSTFGSVPPSEGISSLLPTLYPEAQNATAGCSKVPGDSVTHRGSLAFAPGGCVHGVGARDSEGVVTPFAKPSIKRQGIALA